MFTRFGGITDARVKAQMTRGEHIRALLTQPRFATLRLADEVALLAALAEGVLDTLPTEVIGRMRERLAKHLDATAAEAVKGLATPKPLDDRLRHMLAEAVRTLAQEVAAPAPAQP
jgi:F-type H+-transporting ATPase subunit alpha